MEYMSREDYCEENCGKENREGYKTCKNCGMLNTPTADVQPVKHGYWEEVTDYGGWGDTHYRCSVCGEEWYLEDGKPKDNNMNFCPRCGARMDGDTND